MSDFIVKMSVELLQEASKIIVSDDALSDYWVLSATDGTTRAKAVSFQMHTPTAQTVASHLDDLSKEFDHPLKWVRLERVVSAKQCTWRELQKELKKYKRNYFRSGIAFPSRRNPTDTPWLLATETELNAYAALYAGADYPLAQVNEKNLTAYLKARFGSKTMPASLDDEMLVYVFKTAGVFFDADRNEIYPLSTEPRTQGRRALPPLNAQNLPPIIEKITHYLGHQVKENGLYEYGHFPCFGRTIGTYNTLRHASSTYALIEGYEFCRDEGMEADLAALETQIELALAYLCDELIEHYPNDLAYVLEINDEIKLGANAVAILALVKYMQVFPDALRVGEYYDLAEKLAKGIVKMQQPDGSFVHILDGNTLDVVAKNRVIYYDGEAAFALMRLYGITRDERWLDCVTRAFDYFIAADHHKAHDHWLSYCSNELVQHKPERKYFEFAVNNVKGYVDFIKNRITTFPTLLELSMAFHKMLLKLDERPEFADVLEGFDVAEFYQALHTRANYLMNGVFFPELAMHYKKPSTVLYGCFIRHHAFRVRIDDVEHYLSGLVAYHQLLKSGKYPKSLGGQTRMINDDTPPQVLTAEGLVAATGGRWIVAPKADYVATGMSIFPKRFRQGHIIVARGKAMEKGYLPAPAVKSLVLKGASAIITDDERAYLDFGVPVLLVKDVKKATIAVGGWVRRQYQGNVIGVTGSAGKTTTVAMLAYALSAFGEVGQSLDSANLPAGIAWNLSMMNQTAPNWVLEMAIGGMDVNSQMVRPDVAIITNIAPAHLEYHKTVEMIAVKKARIFEGMLPNSLAVICRDIKEFEILSEKATACHLKVMTYGEHLDADIRLLEYQAGRASVQIDGKIHHLTMQATGKHQALNALAVLAVAYHQGYELPRVIAQLASFTAVDGRGEISQKTYNNKVITLYNEAYNANPLSMASALAMFDEVAGEVSTKLAIIGDMLELGDNSQQYHLDLVPRLSQMGVREVVLIGQMSRAVSDALSQAGKKSRHFADATALKAKLGEIIQEGDAVLIKASNGIGLQGVFDEPALNAQAVAIAQKTIKGGVALLRSHNLNDKLLPASLTKVLSLMVVWDKIFAENIDINSHVVEVPIALLRGSSAHYQFFQQHEQVPLIKLLQSALVVSSNEAIYALAVWHSGSEAKFVQKMNEKAASIGMADSLFASASGLIRKGYTTAADMLTMAAYFTTQYPQLTEFAQLRTFEHSGKKLPNTNLLLHLHSEVRGLKTGNLVGIGANLINYFIKNNKEYLSVVLLAKSRADCFEISKKMLKEV